MGEEHEGKGGGLVEYRTHYLWAAIIAAVFSLILIARFFQLQILKGDEYEKKSAMQEEASAPIPPRRGRILDSSGRVLAENVSEYGVEVVPDFLEKNPGTLPRLRALLGLNDEDYKKVAKKVQRSMTPKRRFDRFEVMSNVVSDRCPFDGSLLQLGESPEYLWCPACGHHYFKLGRDQHHCRFDEQPLEFSESGRVGRCSACGATYVQGGACPEDGEQLVHRRNILVCPSCGRAFDNQVALVHSHLHELPGVSLKTELRRRYPERFRLGHVLGYMNEVNAKDLKLFGERYRPGDYIGRKGLERSLEGDPDRPFEPNLRGVPGEEVFLRDFRGVRVDENGVTHTSANLDEKSTPAVPGDDVQLTVDVEMQKIVERALRYHHSGAAVVQDVHTGRVLALYSKPGFDPNVWSGRLTRDAKKEYDDNPYSPMLNKALVAYAPGSVYKVVTALAALEEGIVTEETEINCPGYYDFGGRRFRCHKHSGHGDVNLLAALKYSCDVYFYKVGELLGMDRIERYSEEVFGLGVPTGIEIGERVGRVPSKEWHRQHSRIGWQPGFTLSTAVGQGAVLSSPLQIARIYSALANGGRVLKSRIVLQVSRPDGEVKRRYMPEVERVLGVTPEHLALVHSGLVAAVNDDDATGIEARSDQVVIAGKTGTAEAPQVKKGADEEIAAWLLQDHAWFAAYAPAEEPQISVVVFIEHGGGGGKNAAPVAKRIIEEYFRKGFGELPEPADHRQTEDDTKASDKDLDGIR